MKDEPTGIATPEEVLETFTAVLRGENGEKPAEQMKAAENLAKHYGMLAPREEKTTSVKPEIAEEIEAALQSLAKG